MSVSPTVVLGSLVLRRQIYKIRAAWITESPHRGQLPQRVSWIHSELCRGEIYMCFKPMTYWIICSPSLAQSELNRSPLTSIAKPALM